MRFFWPNFGVFFSLRLFPACKIKVIYQPAESKKEPVQMCTADRCSFIRLSSMISHLKCLKAGSIEVTAICESKVYVIWKNTKVKSIKNSNQKQKEWHRLRCICSWCQQSKC